MIPHHLHTEDHAEWSKNIAILAVNGLVVAKIVDKSAFQHAVGVAAETINTQLLAKNFPPPTYDRDSRGEPDQKWANETASLLVQALTKAGLVKNADIDRAIRIAAEEICVRLVMEDRPRRNEDGRPLR